MTQTKLTGPIFIFRNYEIVKNCILLSAVAEAKIEKLCLAKDTNILSTLQPIQSFEEFMKTYVHTRFIFVKHTSIQALLSSLNIIKIFFHEAHTKSAGFKCL